MVSDDVIKKKVLYGYDRKFTHGNLVSNSHAYSHAYSNHTVYWKVYSMHGTILSVQNTESGLEFHFAQ